MEHQQRKSLHQVVNALYRLQLQSVLVEGGAQLLQSFIDEDMWDEARIITNEDMRVANGLQAPVIANRQPATKMKVYSDSVSIFLF